MRPTVVVLLCGLTSVAVAVIQEMTESDCGLTVSYRLPLEQWLCLSHNASQGSHVWSSLHQGGRVLRGSSLLHGRAVELSGIPSGTMLRLWSEQHVCYSLSVGKCGGGEGEGERAVRDAQGAGLEEGRHDSSLHLLLPGTIGLALLPTLAIAIAAFLCCPRKVRNRAHPSRSSRLNQREKQEENMYNITDRDHPLGSEDYTTFQKTRPSTSELEEDLKKSFSIEKGLPTVTTDGVPAESRPKHPLSHSQPVLLEESESSLDRGTRGGSHLDNRHKVTSLSSMHSLGPKISLEGSSGVFSSYDSHPLIVHPLHSRTPSPHPIPPPPLLLPQSRHIRQQSTPSFPLPYPPPSPFQLRPVSIVTSADHQLSGSSQHHPASLPIPLPPLLPPQPSSMSSPSSPISLTDSEALSPERPGKIRPYRVVRQPSPSTSSQRPPSPHACVCSECGERMVDPVAAEAAHLQLLPEQQEVNEGKDLGQETSERVTTQQMVCMSCRTDLSQRLYHELEPSDDESLSSPPPIPSRPPQRPPAPDPVYERIGSVRRHPALGVSNSASSHIYSSLSAEEGTHRPERPRMATPPLLDCVLPHLPDCPNPAGGAPLSRPPRLGLMAHADSSNSDHNYESLPSSFDQLCPQDTSVYAHIEPADEDEVDSPPYVPENSQRIHMLKIDSQGYALVMNHDGEESQQLQTPDPGSGHSQLTPTHSGLSATWPAIPSDYEVPVPVRTSSSSTYSSSLPPNPSPGYPHTSPANPRTSPVHLRIPPVPPLIRQAALTSPPASSRERAQPRSHPAALRHSSSAAEERESKRDSVSSHRHSSRYSTASSGQGENRDSVFESINEDVKEEQEEGGKEEEVGESEKRGKKKEEEAVEKREQAAKQQRRRKIYEVENRVRTKSYPDPLQKQWTENGTRRKYKSMRMLISFNEESQTVV